MQKRLSASVDWRPRLSSAKPDGRIVSSLEGSGSPRFSSPQQPATPPPTTIEQLVYTPEGDKSTWYAVTLYNWLEIPGTMTHESVTEHVGYMFARNFHLIGEYTYDFEVRAYEFTVGFVGAF
jgi:hypothetical protein